MQRLCLNEGTVTLHGEGHRLQGVLARQQRGSLVCLQGEHRLSKAIDVHRRLHERFHSKALHAVLHACLTTAKTYQVGGTA